VGDGSKWSRGGGGDGDKFVWERVQPVRMGHPHLGIVQLASVPLLNIQLIYSWFGSYGHVVADALEEEIDVRRRVGDIDDRNGGLAVFAVIARLDSAPVCPRRLLQRCARK
jgi:hypothetical protein